MDGERIRQAMPYLRDLLTDFGEVIMATAGYEWDEVKDAPTRLTFDHVLGMMHELERGMILLGYESPNTDMLGLGRDRN